jgi:hypothetical protein
MGILQIAVASPAAALAAAVVPGDSGQRALGLFAQMQVQV